MKPLVVALSIGFLILGIAGVVAPTVLWLSWLVSIAGALGTLAAFFTPSSTRYGESGIAGAEGVAAGVLWIIALATRHHGWMTWWTFAFGVAFLVVAAAGAGSYRRVSAPA